MSGILKYSNQWGVRLRYRLHPGIWPSIFSPFRCDQRSSLKRLSQSDRICLNNTQQREIKRSSKGSMISGYCTKVQPDSIKVCIKEGASWSDRPIRNLRLTQHQSKSRYHPRSFDSKNMNLQSDLSHSFGTLAKAGSKPETWNARKWGQPSTFSKLKTSSSSQKLTIIPLKSLKKSITTLPHIWPERRNSQ